jgi:hypothetical protein
MQEEGHNLGFFSDRSNVSLDQIDVNGASSSMPGLVRSDGSSSSTRDATADDPPLSPVDKKRSKLGYHRTAVACGQ